MRVIAGDCLAAMAALARKGTQVDAGVTDPPYGLGLGNAASNAAIMALCGGLIAAFYSEDAAIAGMAAHFLVLAAFFQFFDGLQSTANGALRGIKDTRVPLAITLSSAAHRSGVSSNAR